MSGVKINKETAQIDEGQFCENNLKGAKKILLLYRDVGFLFCFFFVVLENIFCFIVDLFIAYLFYQDAHIMLAKNFFDLTRLFSVEKKNHT